MERDNKHYENKKEQQKLYREIERNMYEVGKILNIFLVPDAKDLPVQVTQLIYRHSIFYLELAN